MPAPHNKNGAYGGDTPSLDYLVALVAEMPQKNMNARETGYTVVSYAKRPLAVTRAVRVL